jgi:hypothetical protein
MSILTFVHLQDGKCEPPTEYPGFGRFGCIPDCGLYTKTTALTIELHTFLNFSKKDSIAWDLINVTLRNNPMFTYNIYSDTMGDFLFEKDLNPNVKTIVDVPDGNLTLYLYQTAEMSSVIDFQQIYNHLGVLDTTLPPRASTTDFAYGDPREVLSSSTVLIDAISTYCWTGVGNPDPSCFNYPSAEILLYVLGSYGMSGTVTMSDGMRGRNALVELPFCSVVPNRTAGFRDPANKRHMIDSAVPCPDRRSLVSPHVTSSMPSVEDGLARLVRGTGTTQATDSTASASLRSNGRRGLVCLNPPNPVTGEVDCSGGLDLVCPLYYYQVCQLRLPPYMANPVDCTAHANCSAAFQAPVCSISGMCTPCKFCQVDADDSVDGTCPQDVCPGSGAWPRCISGSALARTITEKSCPAQVPLSVWTFHETDSYVDVQPAPVNKVRFVTPSNLLIGAMVVTQRRGAVQTCTNQGKATTQSFFKKITCRTSELDGAPYGLDPTFLPSSAIYNGKLQMGDYYANSEIVPSTTSSVGGVNVTTRPTAIGFFSHKYGLNESKVRRGEGDLFRLFFDGRLATDQADAMVSYMSDGGFIDEKTREITVEFVTFSPTVNRFSLIAFTFVWEVSYFSTAHAV